MSEYTKGPWDVNYDGSHWNDKDDYYVTANPTGALGGQRNIALLIGTYTGKQTEANAFLMAAAPDLLEALKAIMGACDQCESDENVSLIDVFTQDMEDKARAAIESAEGKQQ